MTQRAKHIRVLLRHTSLLPPCHRKHMFPFIVYKAATQSVPRITYHDQRNANRVAPSKFTTSMTFDLSRKVATARTQSHTKKSTSRTFKEYS